MGRMHPQTIDAGTDEAGEGRIERLETDLLLEALYQVHGADFRGYARPALTQKLQSLMQAGGIATLSGLQDRLLRSPAQAEALVRALSLRPAGLFDDAAAASQLRRTLCPYLRSCPLPKIWIAESTSAEDVFALVILLIEEGLYDKTLIFVTAADETLLAETRLGAFPWERMAQYDASYRASGGTGALSDYCEQRGDMMIFTAPLRRNLIWAQYNLVTDRSFNEFQFISCRRVLAEFGPSLRRRSLQLFADSLAPFGILGVDVPDELEAAPMAMQFQTVSRANGLYRRIAGIGS
jgi:chemotaxis protein methyltransferase CheR